MTGTYSMVGDEVGANGDENTVDDHPDESGGNDTANSPTIPENWSQSKGRNNEENRLRSNKWSFA